MAQLPVSNSDTFAEIDDEDLPWASRHRWRIDEDGMPVRDTVDQFGRPKVIYLCNEVVSRRTGTPLHHFGIPVLAQRARARRLRLTGSELPNRTAKKE
jgi:hypothetical protein